ncbi:MAG: Re/Si-specific NAD(P)(+) transhydrogenase subunit alpha [Deltaproteobacteria bacterium]|nr:Re/Si-specific NAD(P)(+) transhydrogenase subunit alpha [Deltaproteobacteria bacterium]
MPTIFIPKEVRPGETRVAAVPETVKRMVKDGFTIQIESGAGLGSSIPDKDFVDVGASIVTDVVAAYANADVVLKFHPPAFHEGAHAFEADLPREGAILISYLWGRENIETVKTLARRKITAFALDLLPRITRAQKMDALSSQANLAGYKAVLVAAEKLGRIFPLMMTPAGTLKPAKVVIMGAGVAGLQAIATAKRLGAVVEVSDVRPAVKEQVESLGGKFIDVPTDASMQDSGGYAREASAEFLKKQQEIVRAHVVAADVIITTALVPGKPAPKLITDDMVADMHAGTVIVDLAAERGGNCTLTKPGETIVRGGVTIIGTLNLAATVPTHASDMYAKNLMGVVQNIYKKAELNLSFEDEINAGAIVTHGGEIRIPAIAELVGGGGKA